MDAGSTPATGVFELGAGIIAFLALLIAFSDRIIKNYDDVRKRLVRLHEQIEAFDSSFDLYKSSSDIVDLHHAILQYKKYNIWCNIWGVLFVIGYCTLLINDPRYYVPPSMSLVFCASLTPTSILALYSHRKTYHVNDKWEGYRPRHNLGSVSSPSRFRSCEFLCASRDGTYGQSRRADWAAGYDIRASKIRHVVTLVPKCRPDYTQGRLCQAAVPWRRPRRARSKNCIPP